MRRRRLALCGLLLGGAVLALLLRPEEAPRATGAWMRRLGLEPRFESVGPWRLRYLRTGQGPPVVLLHGFASSVYSWSELIPALAPSHDVLALDFPGFGGSDVPPRLSGADLPPAVLGLLDRLGIRQASFVGNSMGGAVAVHIAAAQPGRVDRLVLIDPAGFIARSERPLLLRLAGSRLGSSLIERLPVRRRLIVLGLRQVFADPTRITAERIEEYVAPLLRPGTAAALSSLLASREDGDFAARLARVSAPTLVLWGRQDRWIPVSQADRFVSAVRGARKVLLEGCGHVPQEECPEEVSRLVAGFLSEKAIP